MAILFDKKRSRYIEIQLFSIADPEWITYKLYGGRFCNKKKCELFKLDREGLFFHNAYEKEVDILLNNLNNIKELHHYTFEPKDEGEFRLVADYKNSSIYIKFFFRVLDNINSVDMKDKVFNVVTTEPLLYEFLVELEKDYLDII